MLVDLVLRALVRDRGQAPDTLNLLRVDQDRDAKDRQGTAADDEENSVGDGEVTSHCGSLFCSKA